MKNKIGSLALVAASLVVVGLWSPSVYAAGNGCSLMTQCTPAGQSGGASVYRFTGVDVYQRQDDSGATTIFARKPNCTLPPGQCLVTVRDKDGNTVRTYLSTGLEAGAPKASPIPTDYSRTGGYTPIDPERMRTAPAAPSETILYSPTRMFGAFYDPYPEYSAPVTPIEMPRTQIRETYREIYREFAQPMPEEPMPEIRKQAEVISTDHLSNESVHLQPNETAEETAARIAAMAGNSASTFVSPDSEADSIDAVTSSDDSVVSGRNNQSDESFDREFEKRYAEILAKQLVPVVVDDSWVENPHVPVIHEEVKDNLRRATDDLSYLKQLETNELCASACEREVVNRENQLRILRAIDDQMANGYTQVIPLDTPAATHQSDIDSSGAAKYLVTLQDARGETFYCTSSGTCTPSDTFVPAAPRRNPIAVAAAPVELRRVASDLDSTSSPLRYAFAEIRGSSASVIQQMTSPSPAFAPRPDYPACSLLTSLIGSCINWQ